MDLKSLLFIAGTFLLLLYTHRVVFKSVSQNAPHVWGRYGQLQARLQIARVIALYPVVLLVDEFFVFILKNQSTVHFYEI